MLPITIPLPVALISLAVALVAAYAIGLVDGYRKGRRDERRNIYLRSIQHITGGEPQ